MPTVKSSCQSFSPVSRLTGVASSLAASLSPRRASSPGPLPSLSSLNPVGFRHSCPHDREPSMLLRGRQSPFDDPPWSPNHAPQRPAALSGHHPSMATQPRPPAASAAGGPDWLLPLAPTPPRPRRLHAAGESDWPLQAATQTPQTSETAPPQSPARRPRARASTHPPGRWAEAAP